MSSVLRSAIDDGELLVVSTALSRGEGDELGTQPWAVDDSAMYLEQCGESTSLSSLLQGRPAKHLQHAADTRSVPVAV